MRVLAQHGRRAPGGVEFAIAHGIAHAARLTKHRVCPALQQVVRLNLLVFGQCLVIIDRRADQVVVAREPVYFFTGTLREERRDQSLQ